MSKEHVIRAVALFLAAQTVSGCATMQPRPTPDSLRAVQEPVAVVCSALEPAEVARRLKKAWERCKVSGQGGETLVPVATGAGGFLYVPMKFGGGLVVDVVAEESQVSVQLSASRRVYNIVADIQTTTQCKSRIIARGVPVGWQWMARQTSEWLDNAEQAGTGPWC